MGASSTWICRTAQKRIVKDPVLDSASLNVVDPGPGLTQESVNQHSDSEYASSCTSDEDIGSDDDEADDTNHAEASCVHKRQRQPDGNDTNHAEASCAHKRQRQPDGNDGCEMPSNNGERNFTPQPLDTTMLERLTYELSGDADLAESYLSGNLDCVLRVEDHNLRWTTPEDTALMVFPTTPFDSIR